VPHAALTTKEVLLKLAQSLRGFSTLPRIRDTLAEGFEPENRKVSPSSIFCYQVSAFRLLFLGAG